MSSRELIHLRRAVECASKLLKKPVIDQSQPEPEAPRVSEQLPQQSNDGR